MDAILCFPPELVVQTALVSHSGCEVSLWSQHGVKIAISYGRLN